VLDTNGTNFTQSELETGLCTLGGFPPGSEGCNRTTTTVAPGANGTIVVTMVTSGSDDGPTACTVSESIQSGVVNATGTNLTNAGLPGISVISSSISVTLAPGPTPPPPAPEEESEDDDSSFFLGLSLLYVILIIIGIALCFIICAGACVAFFMRGEVGMTARIENFEQGLARFKEEMVDL
jgi:hypothetical protein